MADQDLRIKVSAETGAAQDALGKLADEMSGLAKASGGAGTEQQKLAREVAQTTAKVAAAREAVERAKRAQSEASAITQAFGKDSREAAEATDRLRRAEVAATTATREAERALQGAAAAVSAAGKAADEKGVAAVKRLNDQLQRAGKESEKAAQDLRVLEVRMASTGRAAATFDVATKSGGESVSMLGSLVGKVGPMLGGALFAGGAMAAAGAIRDMSGEVFAFETAMANLPFGLEAARKATKGLVNDAQLAQSAAQGLALGVVHTEDEFARLSEAATKLGIKLGIGPSQALDNMMTALGRGSTEILDNLGVAMKASEAYDRYAKSLGKTANELTDAEKKVAFKTEAIKALTAAADATTIGTDSAAAAIQRFGVRADNAAAAAKALTVEVVGGLLGAFEQIGHAVSDTRIDERVAQDRAYVDDMRKLEAATRARAAAEAEFSREWHDAHGGLAQMSAAEIASMEAVGKAAFDNANTLGTLDGELLEHWTTVKSFTASLWNEADAYAAATQRAREHAEAQKKADDDLWKRLEERNAKAETKVLEDAFFAANEMGPALPAGFKRPDEKKAAKDRKNRNQQQMARHEFGAEVADFEFATTAALRAADLEASAAAFEQDKVLREMRLNEMEAAADAEKELSFEHIRLVDAKLQADIEYAQWQQENAVTDEQRQRAATAVEAAESRKRIALVKRAAAEEAAAEKKRLEEMEKEAKRREKITEQVTGAIGTLAEGMIGAFEAMARGEKGAMAEMLADLLKGVAKKHAILALGEFAQGVGSTAATFGIVNPKAAAHFAAAALHTGVAVAAGVGAYAAGQVADARQGTGNFAGGGGSGASGFGPTGNGGASGSNPGARDDEGVQAQETPISHEQLRRENGVVPRGNAPAGPAVQINTVHLYGAGGKAEFVEDIRRAIDRSDRGGRRHRI